VVEKPLQVSAARSQRVISLTQPLAELAWLKLDLLTGRLHTARLTGPCVRVPCEKGKLLASVVAALHALVSLGLIFLILLHAGRGGGVSDMFGGGGMSGGFSSSNVVERNLDRITVAAAAAFSVTTVALTWLWR
jgi:preprotein translocase subunit SecG